MAEWRIELPTAPLCILSFQSLQARRFKLQALNQPCLLSCLEIIATFCICGAHTHVMKFWHWGLGSRAPRSAHANFVSKFRWRIVAMKRERTRSHQIHTKTLSCTIVRDHCKMTLSDAVYIPHSHLLGSELRGESSAFLCPAL